MPNKYHWSQKWGKLDGYVGTISMKLLDDKQKLHAQVTAVAHGQRAHVQIHDGSFHDKYWAKDIATGVENANLFFLN